MRDIGLVLAGGGGRGAYQIGVWQALRELGLEARIGAVAGTSVGALNGALFAQGGYSAARKVWLNLNSDRVLTVEHGQQHIQASGLQWLKDLNLRQTLKEGFFSRQGLLEIIEEHADLKRINDSPLPAFAACCQLPALRSVYFRLNGTTPEKLVQILLASSAIPLVFDMVTIDGETYVDGGLTDNVPLKPLYDAGFRKFIVIHLDDRNYKLDKKFPGADIIEVRPTQDLGNIITGIMDFSEAGARYRINLGYLDGLVKLAPLATESRWLRQLRRWLHSIRFRS